MAKDNRNQSSQLNQEPKDPSTKFVITSRQATTIIAGTIIGAGVLTLPREATEIAHRSAWISALGGAVLAALFMWLITKLGLRFHGKTVMEFAGDLLGTERSPIVSRIIALPFQLFLIATWLVMSVLAMRMFGEAIISAVLQETPLEVVIGSLLISLLFYLVVELEVVARFNELIFPVILVPVIFVGILSFQNAKVTNLLPIIFPDLSGFLQSVITLFFAFEGFSIMLVFMAFTQRENNVRANIGGIAIPGIIYILIIVAALGVFGYAELQHLTWPTLELMKATNYAFFILERVEALFITVWVVAVFTTVGNLFYASCFSLAQLIPTQKEDLARKWIAVCMLPILYWFALLPNSVYQLFEWLAYIGYAGLAVFALVIVFYLLAIIRNKGKETSGSNENRRRGKETDTY